MHHDAKHTNKRSAFTTYGAISTRLWSLKTFNMFSSTIHKHMGKEVENDGGAMEGKKESERPREAGKPSNETDVYTLK